jgi:RNA polymerase sigma-70 factor, ECF subfamily
MFMTDESELIRKAQAGDLNAFEQLVLNYQYEMRLLAMRLAPRGDMADDLAQDVFLEAFRSLKNYSGTGTFRQWLRGIARNLSLQQWKANAKQLRHERDGLAEYIEKLAFEDEPEPLELEEKVLALRLCLKKLPAQSAKLVAMRHRQGLTSEAIAGALNSPPSTVRTALMRIHNSLRECVDRRLRLDAEAPNVAGAEM